MKTSVSCAMCILGKQLAFVKERKDDKSFKFMKECMELFEKDYFDYSPPWFYTRVQELKEKTFNQRDDYKEIKHKYNQMLLALEDMISKKIEESDDVILESIKYSILGNYIDFAALKDFNEDKLVELINEAYKREVDQDTYNKLLKDLNNAKSIVFLTDNCGEVVFDKVLIEELKKVYPGINITCILRGEDTLNDATLEDAKEIGLDKVCKCIGNGNAYPSTLMNELSEEAKDTINNADIIISKGQGNFEGLYKSDLNIYYVFLVKCELFCRMLKMPKLSTFFKKEEDVVTYL